MFIVYRLGLSCRRQIEQVIARTLETRREQHFKLSSQIAGLNDVQLQNLLGSSKGKTSNSGYGANQTLNLGVANIFVKRIPITDIEYRNLFSTKNLYALPTYCSYGIGSPGFNVFRELLTYIKTTHWVLAGEISTFPLLYHYRILPLSGQRENVDTQQLREYVEYWNNCENVGQYVIDRANASYELFLFLEHIPYVLAPWLQENPSRLQKALNDLKTAIDFLRSKGIIHFDAHFYNALTDGKQTYLADFGLVLDRSFALTKEEESFFEDHTFYDYGEILRNLGHLIRPIYKACPENDKRRIMEKYGIEEGLPPYKASAILLDNIEHIHADRILELDDFYVASIVQYRSIIALTQSFFADIYSNHRKDTPFPHEALQQLLQETGFLEQHLC